jgi:hypothetical protein
MRALPLRHPFYPLALLIVGTCAFIARSRAFALNPDVAAWGITFDLTITIPLLFWFFVVRPGKAKPLTLAPVFIVGTLLATMLLPKTNQQFVQQLRMLVPLAEIVLVLAFLQRARRMKLEHALAGEGLVAEIIGSELAMLYFAFRGWGKEPEAVDGRPFTVHERSGWSSIVACIIVLIVAEGIGMHFLIGRWNANAAWVWTLMDLWAIVWLLGDYQALRLRRSFIDGDTLHLRYGMRWSVDVPLASIVSVEEVRGEWKKQRGILKVALFDDPKWLITLAAPITAKGMAGLRKEIHGIALLADDDEIGPLLKSYTAA